MERSPARRRLHVPAHLVFGSLLAAGLVVRILAMRSTWGQPDGDDAMVMMMSFRASQGHFALLFPGGNYGGAVITWIEGPLIWLVGVKTWLFRVVDTAQCVGAALLLRAIGRRFLAPIAADVAAGTFFFFPALWLFWSAREYIFWLPSILFALAACLLILQWFESRRVRLLGAIGLCAGLSIWCYPLVFPLVGPALAVLAWDRRRDRPALLRVAAGGLIGVSPWIAFFAIHGRAATHLQTVTGSRVTNLEHTVTQVLPTALVGGEKRAGVIWLLTNASAHHLALLGVAVYLAVAAYTAFAVIRRQVALAVCGAGVLVWPFVLVLGHVPINPATFRYGVIPIAPLLLLAADALARVRVAPLLGVGALVLVVHTISADTSGFTATTSCYRPLVDTSHVLESLHRTDVWASYWLSAPLELCSTERVTASAVSPPRRDHQAEIAAADAPRSTYVVFPGQVLDRQLQAWTRANHVRVTRSTAGGFAIWEFDVNISPERMGLNSAF